VQPSIKICLCQKIKTVLQKERLAIYNQPLGILV
jgi:hypothetical protein